MGDLGKRPPPARHMAAPVTPPSFGGAGGAVSAGGVQRLPPPLPATSLYSGMQRRAPASPQDGHVRARTIALAVVLPLLAAAAIGVGVWLALRRRGSRLGPPQDWLAAALNDGSVVVTNGRSGRAVGTYHPPATAGMGQLTALAWAPGTGWLAAADGGSLLLLWPVTAAGLGTPVAVRTPASVTDVTWAPDASALAAVHVDGRVSRLTPPSGGGDWSVAGPFGTALDNQDAAPATGAGAWASTGRALVVGSGTELVQMGVPPGSDAGFSTVANGKPAFVPAYASPATPMPAAPESWSLGGVAVGPNAQLAVGAWGNQGVALLRLPDMSVVGSVWTTGWQAPQQGEPVTRVRWRPRFQPHGSPLVANAASALVAAPTFSTAVTLLDSASGQAVAALSPPSGGALDMVAWAPDASALVVAGSGGTSVEVLDPARQSFLRSWTLPFPPVALAWAPT